MRKFEDHIDEMDRLGVLEAYVTMCEAGQSPSMAAMLAAQQPPGIKGTDGQFQRQEEANMRGIEPDRMNLIQRIAKRSGINTAGKMYVGALGKYQDPLAWVSDTNDVKKSALAKQMDVEVNGTKVNGYRGPKKKTRIATDILDRLEGNARRKDKSLDQKCKKSDNARRELRSALTNKHTKAKD